MDEEAPEGDGAVLGYAKLAQLLLFKPRYAEDHLLDHAHYEALLFNLIRLHGIRILKDFAYKTISHMLWLPVGEKDREEGPQGRCEDIPE